MESAEQFGEKPRRGKKRRRTEKFFHAVSLRGFYRIIAIFRQLTRFSSFDAVVTAADDPLIT